VVPQLLIKDLQVEEQITLLAPTQFQQVAVVVRVELVVMEEAPALLLADRVALGKVLTSLGQLFIMQAVAVAERIPDLAALVLVLLLVRTVVAWRAHANPLEITPATRELQVLTELEVVAVVDQCSPAALLQHMEVTVVLAL
jgi:hypothetical protein